MKTSSSNPSVDIIVPIYNTPANLLEQCFLSVLKQNYKNVKIIAVDDGSTRRGTLEIINKYSDEENFEVYEQKNMGVSSARNTGLEHSTGDYVFFLDSDDYIDNDYIERLLSIMDEKRVSLVFSGKVGVPGNKNDAPFKDHFIDLESDSDVIALRAAAFTCSGVLIDGKLARKQRFTTTTTMGEDTEYIIKVMTTGDSYFDGHGGCYYVQNTESLTHDIRIKSIQRFLDESVIEANALKKYINISKKTNDIFLYSKITSAHRKLSLNYGARTACQIVNAHIKKYGIKKPKMSLVIENKLLSKGQKIRIILLSKGLHECVSIMNKAVFCLKGLNK